jgi:NAD(P)H-quinone oxidoreductase subunit 3
MERMTAQSPVLGDFGFVALVLVMAVGLALLAAAAFARAPARTVHAPPAWAQFRFGYAVYALIFLAFDMLLSAGIAYAWGMGGLRWE